MNTEPPPRVSRANELVVLLAALSTAAAMIHAVVTPKHFEESAYLGTFFTVAAAAQLGWAVWILVRPKEKWLYILGAVGNLAIACLWVLSRTAGVPIGPDAWTPEAVHAIDLLATLQEVAIASISCLIIARWTPPRVLRLKAIRAGTWHLVLVVIGGTAWQLVLHH